MVVPADYQEALGQIQQALAIARAESNQFELAFCQLMAAYALITMDRFAESLPYLENSLGLFEELEELYYMSWVLHRLGYVYSNLQNPVKGIEYTERSLNLARFA